MKLISLMYYRCLPIILLFVTLQDIHAELSSPPLKKVLTFHIFLIGKGDDHELVVDGKDEVKYYNNPNRSGPRIDDLLNSRKKDIENTDYLVVIHRRGNSAENVFKQISTIRAQSKKRIWFADTGLLPRDSKYKVIIWDKTEGGGETFTIDGIKLANSGEVLSQLLSNKVSQVVIVDSGSHRDGAVPQPLKNLLNTNRIEILSTTEILP